MNERRAIRPPSRLESWAQTIVIAGAVLGAVWTARGKLDALETNQRAMMAHLCRIEVVLHQLSFEECQAMVMPVKMAGDPPGGR